MSRTEHHGKRAIRQDPWWKRRWSGPVWWHRLTTGARKKAEERELLQRQQADLDAELAWPVHARKPHNYYW